jgi:catechol 2,3-dioxygenase-like lactoylglutathione lyase family enzyme
MKMLAAIPAMPVKDLARSLEFYRDKLGLTLVHQEGGFAVLRSDDVVIHLWVANDESWRTRAAGSPIVSGAESFIAGTASCRIGVEGVDELFRELEPLGVMHGKGGIEDTWWGDREFHTVDPDGNLVTFFQRG